MPREVRFAVTCADTRVGQSLRVVGSVPSLGDWDPPKGWQLTTTAQDFPLWKSTGLVAVDEETQLEYKYVICDNNGNPCRWEERANRSLHLAPLVTKGTVEPRGTVALIEGFNGQGQPDDPARFSCIERESSASMMMRIRSQNYPERDHPPGGERADGADMFEPTMRERCPSQSMFHAASGQMSRNNTASMSHFGTLGLSTEESRAAPEVTNADVEVPSSPAAASSSEAGRGLGGLGGSYGNGLANAESGLVREESCSNLFLHEPDVDEQEPESCEFEQRYSLVGQGPLGEGTFGLVWRCVPKAADAAPSRSVAERAAKIVRKARLQPRDMRYLLGDDGEVNTHLTMKHPNIVELFEYFNEPQSVTLVLEFCRGGDLFDAIIEASKTTGRGFPENAAAVATTHVLSALAYVHGQSVVHRDVKCENVLLSQMGVSAERNVFKLCDFGFAAHDRGEGFSDRLGSPDTVAPEVVAGTRYSFPADLWSTGTLVYMMLSATPPFYAPTDHDVLRKVRAGNYSLSGTLWDSVSAPPKHVITSLMTVDAKLRPTASEALKKAWLKDVPLLER